MDTKFSILQQNLKGAVNNLSKIKNSNSLSILESVYITAKDEKIEMTASDLSTTMTVTIGGKVYEEEYEVLLPAKDLKDLAGTLSQGRVDFVHKVEDDNHFVELRNGDGVFGFPVQHDTVDYPPVKVDVAEASLVFKISASNLRNALENTVIATTIEDNRPVLQYILIEQESDIAVSFVSADGFRLALSKSDLVSEAISLKTELKFHLDTAKLLLHTLPKDDTQVTLLYISSNNTLVFSFDNTVISSLNGEGRFPDFKVIMPKSFDTQAIVNIDNLLKASIRAEKYAKHQNYSTIYRFVPSHDLTPFVEVMAGSKNHEKGYYKGEVETQLMGWESTMVCNVGYVIDYLKILKKLGHEEVAIRLNMGDEVVTNNPIVFTSLDENTQYLVMPILKYL